MAHTARSMIDVLESIDAHLATIEASQAAIEAAVAANTAAVLTQAADISVMKDEMLIANDIARYLAEHTYGPDPDLP